MSHHPSGLAIEYRFHISKPDFKKLQDYKKALTDESNPIKPGLFLKQRLEWEYKRPLAREYEKLKADLELKRLEEDSELKTLRADSKLKKLKADLELKRLKEDSELKKLEEGLKAPIDEGTLRSFIAGHEDKEFLALLLRTKRSTYFFDLHKVSADSNWSRKEAEILGGVSCTIPVQVYDNGHWEKPIVHDKPFPATLLFVPGALLKKSHDYKPPDYEEVNNYDGTINEEAFYRLYERRLLPGLLAANKAAKSDNKEILLTLPGIGCGEFARGYENEIRSCFIKAIKRVIENNANDLSAIKGIWLDPFKDIVPEAEEIGGIPFIVQPFLCEGGLTQLSTPEAYFARFKTAFPDKFKDEDVVNYKLLVGVAGDHGALPLNDFNSDFKTTDEGVKGGATNAETMLTGVEGEYNLKKRCYKPVLNEKNTYSTWIDVHKASPVKISADLIDLCTYNFERNYINPIEKNVFKTYNASQIDAWLGRRNNSKLGLTELKKCYLADLQDILDHLREDQKKDLCYHILTTSKHVLKKEKNNWLRFFSPNYSHETRSVSTVLEMLGQKPLKAGDKAKLTLDNEAPNKTTYTFSRHVQ